MVRLDLLLCRSGVAELVQLGCVPDCIVWLVSMLGLICIRLVHNLTEESSISELCYLCYSIMNVIFSGRFLASLFSFLYISPGFSDQFGQ